MAAAGLVVFWSAPAHAAPACPNPVPVVHENNCMGAGDPGWRLSNPDERIGGYTTKTSYNRGENVVLKIGRDAPLLPQTRVHIRVFRSGYYGGTGGRFIGQASQNDVAVNNSFACNAMDPVTGKLDCGNWQATYTIPASALPASGIYIAKLTTTDTGWDTHVVFTVRDDNRSPESKLLYVLPVATYQAYNAWGGKSLYFDKNGGPDTVSGTGRAVKVSFNRPLDKPNIFQERDRYVGVDYPTVFWLEWQGYDVSYTDDVQAHLDAPELRQHKTLVIGGHSEYWSGEQFGAVKAARDAGTNIASFSANTAYWKVRYEDGGRTLVCYKTVQGSGSAGSGTVGANDWGPDGVNGTSDDALGADGRAGTSDDRPQNSSTTFRDNGAPPGDPNAPPGGRVGPDSPENSLFGVMFVGQANQTFPMTVPAGNANGEFAADKVWRNTSIPTDSSTTLGNNLVGWEWDAIPTQAQYTSRQPAGVKRLSATNTTSASSEWLQDEGRVYANSPPPGQPNSVGAVKYRAPSGALVFASGSMHWAFGLSYDVDRRIQQATYNVLSDTGVEPDTPDGVTLNPLPSFPTAFFTATPSPASRFQTVNFNGSGSSDPDGTIVKYEWDLDGNGSFERNTGTTPTTSRQYSSTGTFQLKLRVTDNEGLTAIYTRALKVGGSNTPPTAAFTMSRSPTLPNRSVSFDGSSSSDPDGHITKYEWDLDGNGSYETVTGTNPKASRAYPSAGSVTVRLRVTDSAGGSATTTRTLSVEGGPYAAAVAGTPGLVSYWRLGESSGTSLADSVGSSNATASGATLGVAGALAGDPDRAASFDGQDDSAQAPVNLSGTQVTTVEFWLRWNAFADDDHLAFELTPNFNANPGGFLVDPNSTLNQSFGVGFGLDASRNNAFFDRPSAGEWHHYALVFDGSAPAASQVTPYVDGQPVPYTKTSSGTGAGQFANSVLYFMSRGGSSLFGGGQLDELALYDRALAAATVQSHYQAGGGGAPPPPPPPANTPPSASFTFTPSSPRTGQTVTYNGSGSSDAEGPIAKYEWDLDGNGSYEVSSTTSASTSRSYSSSGTITVRLRVTDSAGATAVTTRSVTVSSCFLIFC